MEQIRYGKTCDIIQENTGRQVQAEVFEFKELQKLTVVLNKSVKLAMVWNGKFYEGRAAGMDFISDGPEITRYTTGLRG